MNGVNSQKQLFQSRLQQALHEYIPAWEKGDQDLGVATKTLQRWIDGSNTPNDGSIRAFLDAVGRVREDFPKAPIMEAFQMARSGKYHSSMEQEDLIGSDAYDRRFSEWCALAKPDSQIWIVQNWLLYPMKFTEEFVSAVKRGAQARMLLLKPDSPLVNMRYETTKVSLFSFYAYLEDMPRTIQDWHLHEEPAFELRFYEAPPAFASYVVDENILFAPFWARHTTSEAPHLALTSASAFGRTVMEDIDYVWKVSPEITMERALTVFHEALEARVHPRER